MKKRLTLLAGAAVAVMFVTASATATSHSARTASLSAAPFAQSWAQIPRTTAARKAKDTLVFGEEQDIDGFNTSLTHADRARDVVRSFAHVTSNVS